MIESDIQILSASPVEAGRVNVVVNPKFFGTTGMSEALAQVSTPYVGLVTKVAGVSLSDESLSYMLDCMSDGVAAVYADYLLDGATRRMVSLNDAEAHVLRDSFDFGPVVVARTSDVAEALKLVPACDFSALYGVLLGLQSRGSLYHTALLVGSFSESDARASDQKQFDYVNPLYSQYQKELEVVCTAHLKSIGAFVDFGKAKAYRASQKCSFEASVVIPVRNRCSTIADAVKSALNQKTSFPFNVIVVDNHSTDGTTDVLASLSDANPNLVHLIPEREDLGIGGCWNAAIDLPVCGRIAVQLDSDDLYISDDVLQKVVDKFNEKDYAMVVGSYKLVDFNLNLLPPGIIDHKEWTDNNGPNNMLRINGLGAPRAFVAQWLRENPFPNVSYGEDYAVGLRATRQFFVGRIFEPLYLCRRWGGNSDAGLKPEQEAAHNAYKDKLRSDEVVARIAMNKES